METSWSETIPKTNASSTKDQAKSKYQNEIEGEHQQNTRPLTHKPRWTSYKQTYASVMWSL